MKKANPIRKYMTKCPHTIGEDIPLSKAMEMMREHQIRHLPVQSRAKLVGVISDRDIKLALTLHPAAKDLRVGDIMSEEPYSVTEDCPLEQVAAEMARNKYGCAVVENEQGRAVGIFTMVDATGLLGECVRENALRNSDLRVISW